MPVTGVRLGSFMLDRAKCCVVGPKGPVELRPKAFAVLAHLAANPGRVVRKDELLEAVWPDVTVTEDVLTHCISEVRRSLGAEGSGMIETVPRQGYMLVPPTVERGMRSDWELGQVERSDLLPFARRHHLMVLATNSATGMPQASVVRFLATDTFELVFTANVRQRKLANLRHDARASAVIGWDDYQTLQVEGTAAVLIGQELDKARRLFAELVPAEYEWRRRIEGLEYIRLTPAWMRFSDFRKNPASVLTVDIASGSETRAAAMWRADPA